MFIIQLVVLYRTHNTLPLPIRIHIDPKIDRKGRW